VDLRLPGFGYRILMVRGIKNEKRGGWMLIVVAVGD